ncbi:MAG TPA: dihydropteroate synthase [Bacteroidales bacterium]|nr:dihydropteroate synthase [Bacteroidales bacterium]
MGSKDTLFSGKQTINCRGRLIDFAVPRVMGILNITPDSFYDGGRFQQEKTVLTQVTSMIRDGADIIDIGAASSRPGAEEIPEAEEMSRLKIALHAIRHEFPDILLSIDTFRANVAEYGVKEYGADMVNDISSGLIDNRMLSVIGTLKVPYIMMHMQGTPATMQVNPEYDDVVRELLAFFADRTTAARNAGIIDIIVDPGFGFGKTLQHNFQLLKRLKLFEMLGLPIMAGFSRKSMITRSLNIQPEAALNGTTVLNILALNNGANMLRVHDVLEAAEAVKLFMIYRDAED